MEREIRALRQKKNAVILAHYYQLPEIQAIADYIGDSLELSRIARDVQADMIVFCGVRFMAETAKILAPHKKVVIPEISAGCPLADSITADQLRQLKRRYPGYAVVSYVNTSAEIKALSDVCCTSANAVKVVRNIPDKKIIFVPDSNLGHYVKQQVGSEKEMVIWPGNCYVHAIRATRESVEAQKKAHPNALVLAHPECTPSVLELADFVGSTSQIIKFAKENASEEFIIVTERGIEFSLKKQAPDKKFYFVPQMVCFNMKKITLPAVLRALKDEIFEIKLSSDIIESAKKALDRMLEYV